ncbi:MAG: hypothetical protein GXO94_05500 [Nitrospirae bacterium]|nr:hypothetical protein [Nitrospirota bacterium]
MPVEGVHKVNEPLVIRERTDVVARKDERETKKRKKKKAKDTDKKRKGIVDILA